MNLSLQLLAAAAALQADTVYTAPVRDGFDLIVAVTGGLIGATFLAVLLTFLFVLSQARKVARGLDRARKEIATDPGIAHLRRTAANLEAISETLRGDMAQLTGAVGGLSERLDQVSGRMEERIEAFNALMEVVQDEAEEAFLDTASTARGVRRGLGEYGSGRASERVRSRLQPEPQPRPSTPRPAPRPSPGLTPAPSPTPGPTPNPSPTPTSSPNPSQGQSPGPTPTPSPNPNPTHTRNREES